MNNAQVGAEQSDSFHFDPNDQQVQTQFNSHDNSLSIDNFRQILFNADDDFKKLNQPYISYLLDHMNNNQNNNNAKNNLVNGKQFQNSQILNSVLSGDYNYNNNQFSQTMNNGNIQNPKRSNAQQNHNIHFKNFNNNINSNSNNISNSNNNPGVNLNNNNKFINSIY